MGFNFRLSRTLAIEQLAFLRRPRRQWNDHLQKAREFIGSALQNADSTRPVLILGAGWGLEIPWKMATSLTYGWDADPLSKIGTFIRHRRWVPWMFEDITGALVELDRVSRRVQTQEGLWIPRPAPVAAKRLAGLLPSVIPKPATLEAWVKEYRPGTIICANVLGQINPLAYKIVESAFKPRVPWADDLDVIDPLQEAMEQWIAKTVRAILTALNQCGSKLYLLHDRGVIHHDVDLELGDWTDPWTEQLRTSADSLEANDPLSGVNILEEYKALQCRSKSRWIWHIGPSQIHVVEALIFN